MAIGKRITPHSHFSTRDKEGNRHYCFVDFATHQEADRARRDLDGVVVSGIGKLRVSLAKGTAPTRHKDELSPDDISLPRRSFNRDNNSNQQTLSPSGKTRNDGATRESREERDAKQRTILATNNWRSKAAPVTE